MVEQITINPEEVRGYGNVLEEHELDDFTVNVSSLSKVSETVHGALTNTYKLLYSVYGLMFDFDKGAKQLYLQTNEADTLSLGFDTVNKQLYLVDENDTGFNLGFDEDTNELYITDDAPPIVHNYTLALDSDSYTTTGSLSVSSTLLDDGVAVSGATVSFTGGTSTVTATTDSSGVATATVTFSASGTLTATYSNVSDTATVTVSNILWQPAMDGTDSMSNFGSGTRYKDFTDGVCTCAKYCFSDSWDNSIDWEMTFDLKCLASGSQANNGVEIIDSTQTAPDHYCLAILADSKYFTNYIPTTTAVGETISNIAKNTWVSIKVTKVGTTLTVYFNDTLFETYTNCEWSRSKLAFHSWSSNYTQVKNIIVESI